MITVSMLELWRIAWCFHPVWTIIITLIIVKLLARLLLDAMDHIKSESK